MNSIVSVLQTSPDSIRSDYIKLMTDAGIDSFLDSAISTAVIAEVGLNSFYPAATPPPWMLEGVIYALESKGNRAGQIDLLVRSLTGFLNRGNVVRHFGQLNAKYNISNRRGNSVEPIEAAKDKNVIVLGTLRTHVASTICGALTNAALVLRPSGQFRPVLVSLEEICERFRQLKSMASGVFGVLDGTFAGDGSGPRCLRLFTKNFILASSDLVALDAVAAKMMGYDPMSIPYLRRAQEENLGCADLSRIEICGADITTVDFRFHVTAEESSPLFGNLVRRLRLSENKHTWRYGLLIFLIEQMQDLYVRKFWFEKVGKKRRALAAQSLWGNLLKDYGLNFSEFSFGVTAK